MIQIIGYAALTLNLISMSMKNILYLRVCSLTTNAIYIVYGVLMNAPPMFIGCSIGVLLHSYYIYKIMRLRLQKSEQTFNSQNIT
ncbi:hypothetical protein [Chryseobacterium luquanense]|uniref:Inner membrane protein n=1 Tax=Chryseobacterium luquanense TaxID=2983766 RepID=A0ABT3Y7J6_9FLAO|nr:hypothetical protein [Chryseobacterium luquanense]MCX8534127.1 hypothetical protein [Chryseobacterium luquanense]